MRELPKSVSYSDRLLPDRDAMIGHFAGEDFTSALYATICRTNGLRDDSGFAIAESDDFPQSYMGSDPVSLAFLRMLIVLSGARRVLEIGSFVGVSAMVMAQVLPQDGRVVTIEKFSEFAKLANDNFRRNDLDDKIVLLEGDASEVLPGLARERFDFFFIDGHKEKYLYYFLQCEKLAAENAVFVIDDCLFRGDVLNAEPTTEKGRGVKAFLDHMATRSEYNRLLLPMCAGLFVAYKRRAS